MLTIRSETPEDIAAIHRVERDAFGSEDEPRLVDALRDGGHLLLSLVAEDDGEIVGHVAFSPMTVEGEGGAFEVVALGPIAVATQRQKQGIGGALMQAGFDELREAGHAAVVLLGHTSYYPRFGFRPAREFGLHYQDDRDSFMALELTPGALDDIAGLVRFAPEFAPYE